MLWSAFRVGWGGGRGGGALRSGTGYGCRWRLEFSCPRRNRFVGVCCCCLEIVICDVVPPPPPAAGTDIRRGKVGLPLLCLYIHGGGETLGFSVRVIPQLVGR